MLEKYQHLFATTLLRHLKYEAGLFSTTLFSSSGILIKIVCVLLLTKMIAVYSGAAGVAIFGQYISLITIMAALGCGGINFGVIKNVAAFKQNPDKLSDFISASLLFTLICITVSSVVLWQYDDHVSQWLFNDTTYTNWIDFVALGTPLLAGNAFISAIVMGQRRIRQLFLINTITSLSSLIIALVFFYPLQMKAAFIATVLAQGIGLLSALWLIKLPTIQWKPKRHFFDSWKDLSHYSVMTLVSSLSVTVAFIIIRQQLAQSMGWEATGYFQAVTRISDAYLVLLSTILMSYYLPKLSAANDQHEIRRIIKDGYSTFIPFMLTTTVIIWILRHPIIILLYSKTFLPTAKLMIFYFVGDIFRVAGWLMTYVLIAKRKTFLYLSSEILLSLYLLIGTTIGAKYHGILGASCGLMLAFVFYWFNMLVFGKMYLEKERSLCLNP